MQNASAILAESARGIEKHRKGEMVLEFRQVNGSPAEGATVQVSQISHDFPFGVPLRPRHYTDTRQLEYVKQMFNFVQLLEFNWGQYEPDEGKPLREERLRFIHEWCRPNGIRHLYGHMLVWTRQYGEYPKTGLPLWLFRYDRATQYELLKKRVQREVRDYKDVDMLWDVVNEPIHCRLWGEWEKPNRYDEPLDKVFGYVADALRWAHEANPQARLLINEYELFADETARERFARLIQMLQDAKVPLHAVGIQAHDYQAAGWMDPRRIWETCELFGTQLGLPIIFTELCFFSDPKRRIEGGYRTGTWNPERQADAAEEFYRVAFGHPSTAGIIYFGLVGSEIWEKTTGLLNEEGRPKPAYERLRRLVNEEWRTQQSGRTGKDGTLTIRGFTGRYRVEVEYRGKHYHFETHLSKQGVHRASFVLTDK